MENNDAKSGVWCCISKYSGVEWNLELVVGTFLYLFKIYLIKISLHVDIFYFVCTYTQLKTNYILKFLMWL